MKKVFVIISMLMLLLVVAKGSALYEEDLGDHTWADVNGDDIFNFEDVVYLFKKFDSPEFQENWWLYDFDGDGRLTFGDVVTLFKLLY